MVENASCRASLGGFINMALPLPLLLPWTLSWAWLMALVGPGPLTVTPATVAVTGGRDQGRGFGRAHDCRGHSLGRGRGNWP